MASEKERDSFIKEMAPIAQKAYKELGKVRPSVCIAMACVESAYGTSKVMRSHNAFFGFKCGSGKTATKYWDGAFFKSKTKEEYTVGTHTVITDAFRSYKDMEQSVYNFYELLNTKLYSKVTDCDPESQMAQIKLCGYMTSSTEVNTVISIIKKYNLTQYDSVSSINIPAPVTSKPSLSDIYKVGKVYVLQANMFVRAEPNGRKKKFFELTYDGKVNSLEDIEGNAVLKKGTRVTCKAVAQPDKAIWMQIPSGWVCAKAASGKMFIS